MKEEMIEGIFGCLERIEEKLDKQPVQTEQDKSEEGSKPMEVLEAMAASQEQGHKRLEALWAVLKIISDRQKESKKELLDAISSKFEVLSAKDDGALADEIHALRQLITEQTSKPQHKKVIHDLTAKTWYLVGIGIILFFCISLLTTKIYDQSKQIDELQLAGWKYRALRATLPVNNANVIWLERNVWAGNKEGIRHCQQFVIRSTLVAWLVQELRGLYPSPLSDGSGSTATRAGRAAADARVRQHQETVKKVVHDYS